MEIDSRKLGTAFLLGSVSVMNSLKNRIIKDMHRLRPLGRDDLVIYDHAYSSVIRNMNKILAEIRTKQDEWIEDDYVNTKEDIKEVERRINKDLDEL